MVLDESMFRLWWNMKPLVPLVLLYRYQHWELYGGLYGKKIYIFSTIQYVTNYTQSWFSLNFYHLVKFNNYKMFEENWKFIPLNCCPYIYSTLNLLLINTHTKYLLIKKINIIIPFNNSIILQRWILSLQLLFFHSTIYF